MSHRDPDQPFRRAGLNRANDIAKKLDQPLFTVGYRIVSTVGLAAAGAFGVYLLHWLDKRIAENPSVTETSARVVAIEKSVVAHDAQFAAAAAAQTRIESFMAENLKAQQSVGNRLSTLNQKVIDGQDQAKRDVKRIDDRLDALNRSR